MKNCPGQAWLLLLAPLWSGNRSSPLTLQLCTLQSAYDVNNSAWSD